MLYQDESQVGFDLHPQFMTASRPWCFIVHCNMQKNEIIQFTSTAQTTTKTNLNEIKVNNCKQSLLHQWRGTGRWEHGRIGVRRGTGGEKREGRKRDSQGGRNQEKLANILQHFITLHNRNYKYMCTTKRWEPLRKWVGTGSKRKVKGTESRKFTPPCPSTSSLSKDFGLHLIIVDY